jgi:hypothetical protein
MKLWGQLACVLQIQDPRPVILKRWSAANIMKVYFKNEKKLICIEIYYIHYFYFYS